MCLLWRHPCQRERFESVALCVNKNKGPVEASKEKDEKLGASGHNLTDRAVVCFTRYGCRPSAPLRRQNPIPGSDGSQQCSASGRLPPPRRACEYVKQRAQLSWEERWTLTVDVAWLKKALHRDVIVLVWTQPYRQTWCWLREILQNPGLCLMMFSSKNVCLSIICAHGN